MKEEGDESDGEESHEEHGDEGDEERSELLTQPMLPPTAQPTLDALAQATASPIAHINNLLAIHPHLIAKFNMEVSWKSFHFAKCVYASSAKQETQISKNKSYCQKFPIVRSVAFP